MGLFCCNERLQATSHDEGINPLLVVCAFSLGGFVVKQIIKMYNFFCCCSC